MALARVLARRIFLKTKKLSDFRGDLHEAIKRAYLEMYCEECPNE